MSLRTRIETRTDTMNVGGKPVEFTYNVTMWLDTLPAPSQESPYCEGGRCKADARDVRRDARTATPAIAKRRPTKPEYVRAFYAAGIVPRCVIETICAVGDRVAEAIGHLYDVYGAGAPKRLARAVNAFRGNDIASYYDTGTHARMRYELARAESRRGAHRRKLDTYAAKLWAQTGTVRPMTIAAVVAR